MIADASAARSTQRVIRVHLTPFAPGMEKVGTADPRRWKTFWNRDLAPVVRALLKRLQIVPADLTVSSQVNGDVDLEIAPPPALAKYLSGKPERVPVAVFWEGATQAQLLEILQGLNAAGWTPPELDIAA